MIFSSKFIFICTDIHNFVFIYFTFLCRSIWEKKPLHIKREEKNYYKGIISTPIIDALLRTEEILFTKNLDITSYVNNQRETHNPIGRLANF